MEAKAAAPQPRNVSSGGGEDTAADLMGRAMKINLNLFTRAQNFDFCYLVVRFLGVRVAFDCTRAGIIPNVVAGIFRILNIECCFSFLPTAFFFLVYISFVEDCDLILS